MIRFLFAVVLGFILPTQGLAGDTAELEILGFNADGSVFAFEEYGRQDGSGFAYANRFYIDTRNDAFLPGTPIRIRLDEEGRAVADARRDAREAAQEIIADEVLSAHRGFTAGFNAVSEISADATRMEVNPRPVFPPIDAPLEVRLEEIGMAPPELCAALAPRHVGFRLLRIRHEAGGTTELLHEDDSVPESRGCTDGYRIGAVQTFFPENGDPVYVVLVSVRRLGFEGPDHRWIAIPGLL